MILDERSPEEPDPPDEGEDITPDPPTTSIDGMLGPSDAPPELVKAFWSLVLLFNVGILATALGLMFIVFRADLTIGGGLLIVGVLTLGVGIYRYLSLDPESL